MKISHIKAGGTLSTAAGARAGTRPAASVPNALSPLSSPAVGLQSRTERGKAMRLYASLSPGQADDALLKKRVWGALMKKHRLAPVPFHDTASSAADAKRVREEITAALTVLSDGDSIWPRISLSCREGDRTGFEALLVLVRHDAVRFSSKMDEFDSVRTALLKAKDISSPSSEERISVFERMHLLAEEGMDLTMRTSDRQTMLHAAASENARPEVLDALIAQGHRIQSMNGYGQTPLHACLAGEPLLETVEFLLSRGASTTARNSMQETPLSLAAGHDIDIGIVKALIEAGKARQENINAADAKGWTALHNAALAKNRDAVISLLLENGADPHQEDVNGDTPRYIYTQFHARNWDF